MKNYEIRVGGRNGKILAQEPTKERAIETAKEKARTHKHAAFAVVQSGKRLISFKWNSWFNDAREF